MSGKRIIGVSVTSQRDVRANREGKISADQRARLRASRNASLTLALFALAPAILLVVTGELMTIGISIFPWLIVFRESWRALGLQLILNGGRITAHAGRVRLPSPHEQAGHLDIETSNGVRRFYIGKEQALGLRDGEHYLAYTAPLSDAILLIEPANVERTDEGMAFDGVDIGALAEGEAEQPERRVFVLGDDGEVEVRAEGAHDG